MATRDDFKDAASLKAHLESKGCDLDGLEKSIDIFFRLTRTQMPILGIRARDENHILPGFLCVTQDYVIFCKPAISQGKYHSWQILRQDAIITEHYSSNSDANLVIMNQAGGMSFYCTDPHDRNKLMNLVKFGRGPDFQPPPL